MRDGSAFYEHVDLGVRRGTKSRMQSMRDAGNSAALVIIGAVLMLFIAALLEGFGRQLINSDTARYAIAITSLVFWLTYFYWPRAGRDAR